MRSTSRAPTQQTAPFLERSFANFGEGPYLATNKVVRAFLKGPAV